MSCRSSQFMSIRRDDLLPLVPEPMVGRRFAIAGRKRTGGSADPSAANGNATDRTALTGEYLRRRYLVDGLTATQIGVETGWSSQYVRDRLRDYQIPLRPRGLGKARLGRDQLQGWVDAGLTVREIAERANYSTSGVHKLLHQFQIAVPERVRPPLAEQRLLDSWPPSTRRGGPWRCWASSTVIPPTGCGPD
jgi:hypothetical protein